MADPLQVIVETDDDTTTIDPLTGTIATKQPDGGVVVRLNAHRPHKDGAEENPFYANLALDLDGARLAQIANDLIDAIGADDRSRQAHLQTRARGLDLLGIELKEPKSTVGDSSSPVEGLSSVTNPLLLDALLRGWANAVGEVLPADGPVKIKADGEETGAEDD